jgi:transcription antitermination factor NusG
MNPSELCTPVPVVLPGASGMHPWYAIRVKPNFEFVTSRALRAMGYDEFLPVYRSRRAWSDRVKELDMPLFSGYLFSRFDKRDPYRVLNTPGVVHVVSAGREPVPVDPGEIQSLQVICGSGVAAEPWPFLKVGQRVVVERGPLAGAEGVVVRLKAGYRLVASLSLLQRSVAAEIDRESVRPIG